MENKTFNNFIITLNNPIINTEDWLKGLFDNCKAVYVCGQLEKGTEGTIHIQAFINFKKPSRMSACKKYDKKMHIEGIKINNGADTYCMKTDTRIEGPYEYGTKPIKRQSRHDWDKIKNLAKEGKLEEIPSDIYVRSYSNLRKIEKDHLVIKDAEDVRGIWIYGPSGYGKSRIARRDYPNHYPKLCNKWWDGYNGQESVIMDDIGIEHSCLGQQLKIWSDRYGCILETKGGAETSKYTNFIVTSQYSIEEIWKEDEKTIEALKRRFKVIHLLESMFK